MEDPNLQQLLERVAADTANGKRTLTTNEVMHLAYAIFACAAPDVHLPPAAQKTVLYLAHVRAGSALTLDEAALLLAEACKGSDMPPSQIWGGALGCRGGPYIEKMGAVIARMPPWLDKGSIFRAADDARGKVAA